MASIDSTCEAYDLLRKMGAPEHLVTHACLVEEVAQLLLYDLKMLGVQVDDNLVRIGAILHDVGKITQPGELSGPGSHHEGEGKSLLLRKGIESRIARCCVSHGNWRTMECTLEELLVSLADNLWKGKRIYDLELLVIDAVSSLLGRERWDVYPLLDSAFEKVASDGHERLQRSVNG